MRAAKVGDELFLKLNGNEMNSICQGLELAGVRIENEADVLGDTDDDEPDDEDELDDDELDDDEITTNWADAANELDDDDSVHHHEDLFPQRGMEHTDGGYVDASDDDVAPLSPAPLFFGAAGSSATPVSNVDDDMLDLPEMQFENVLNQKRTTNAACGCHKPVRNNSAAQSVGLDDDDDLPNPADSCN